jgi:hypothetical protein
MPSPKTLRSRVLFMMLALALSAMPALAQFNASLQGTVSDQNGAVIPKAKVTVTSNDTGKAVTVTTSDEGYYRVGSLAPGNYSVSVEAPGFKTNSNAAVRVQAESTRGYDVRLGLEAAAQSTTVTAGAEELKTEDANIGTSLSALDVKRLPQAGRDPYELLRLAPGVFGDAARTGSGASAGFPNNSGPGGSNTSVYQVENQVQISANGQRVSANDYQIDGVSVNSLQWGGAAVVTPNQESVKEITVLSSTYSAEDGRNSGAQVKVVSQGGTNKFHGSGFFKYNSPGLNAYNKFRQVPGDATVVQNCLTGTPDAFTTIGSRCPDRVNNAFRQFGASIGGPIWKDKLFFFFSYEGLRNNSTTFGDKYVETQQFRDAIAAQRGGSITAKVLASAGILPNIVSVLPPNCADIAKPCVPVTGGLDLGSITGSQGQYVSLGAPTGGGFDGIPDLEKVQIAFPNQTRGNQYNGRVDYVRGKDSFTFSTYLTQQNDNQSDGGNAARAMGNTIFQPTNSAGMITWNRIISNTMLNEARFNATRFAFNTVSSSSSVNYGIPRIEVEGMLTNGDRVRFGADRGETTPAIFAQNQFEFRDLFTKVLGRQTVKAGFETRWEQDNNNLLGGARPIYSFVTLWNLANDTPIFEGINADPRNGQPADAQRHFRSRTYALFVQDDWKLRPNLTVNLGVRWEYFSPLTEKDGQTSNLLLGCPDGNFSCPTSLTNATIQVGKPLFNPDRNNFAPRLGFAWTPGMFKDKAVLRGGFGVNYNRIPNVLFANTRGNPPFFARYNICCGTAATDFGTPFAGGQILYELGSSNSPTSYAPNPVLSAGIDPATGLPINGAVEIWGAAKNVPTAYVYTYSLETEVQLPASLVATLGWQGSSSHKLIRIVNERFVVPQVNPKFFAVFFPTPDVSGNFNALNANLSRRFNHGFEFQTKYRYSKSIDTLSNEGPGAQTNQTYPLDQRFERGPSDFDAKHALSFYVLYDLPFFRDRKNLLGETLGGWQLNAISTFHSGFPWTPKTFTQQITAPGGDTFGPIRPIAYLGGAGSKEGNTTFLSPNGNFPGGGRRYFDISSTGTPGIGRNTFRGPRYWSMDLSVVKSFAMPYLHLGEGANLELRANAFNVLNHLNLAPFGFFDSSTIVEDPHFGAATNALSGRVVEFQARFSF